MTHDVEEAIFLSDRILVMGNSPGCIKDDIRVNLDRPRTQDSIASVEYLRLHRRVSGLIRLETMKTFNSMFH